MLDIEIAEVAHNVERAFRLALAEPVKYTWKDETDEKKVDMLETVTLIRENIEVNAGKVQEMMHERALKTLCARGYVFGQKEDSNIKTSNIMVRFADLPLEQKAKIAIVYQTIASLVRLP